MEVKASVAAVSGPGGGWSRESCQALETGERWCLVSFLFPTLSLEVWTQAMGSCGPHPGRVFSS